MRVPQVVQFPRDLVSGNHHILPVVGSPVGPVSPVGSYSLDTLDLLPGLYSGVLCACNGKKGGPVCTEFTGFTCRHWVHLLALDPLGTQPPQLTVRRGPFPKY